MGVIFLLLAGCAAPAPAPAATSTSTRLPTVEGGAPLPLRPPVGVSGGAAPLPTRTQILPLSPVPSQTAAPVPSPSLPAPRACSPLEGFDRARLLASISNPFRPPPPGSDQPHAGVDLADTAPGSQVALAGRGVRAFLPGRVAAVIRDRFPFGNALIVETPLQEIPLPGGFILPTSAPTPAAIQSLTCPAPAYPPAYDFSAPRSLYVLYAHLQTAPDLQIGDALACGQPIGQVGMSGNALNPHLHFETRLGPPGLSYASLAHYDVSASPAEMSAYCDWSVRGVFQLVDPLEWINLVP